MPAWLRALEALLVPRACVRCGTPAEGGLFCARCEPLWLRPDPTPAPRPLTAWEAEVPYTGEWKEWIRRFKYPAPGLQGLDPAADAVVLALILRAARRLPPELRAQAVVPVPLHPARFRERGFDQAALLARSVARAERIAHLPRALERTRPTPRQTGLSRGERRRNLRGAFRARRALPPCVWLVDDVATTGSTLAEAARALRRRGARRVVGLCAARTPAGVRD
ncbi:MAG: ComF family protein [Planctomycetota bacterium]|jgi:ComF family protein|nr:hypothetical protein [Deltaproteobacteria bacterium]MDP6540963.1 ComF family protein [Planctomycetota bacterium]